MKKKIKSFFSFSNSFLLLGLFYLSLFFLLFVPIFRKYDIFEYMINGFSDFFIKHYDYGKYLSFVSDFLRHIIFLLAGMFFLITGYFLKKDKNISINIILIFDIYLVLLFSYKLYIRIGFGIDYITFLFLILSSLLAVFIIKIKVEKKDRESKREWFPNLILLFIFLLTLIFSLYEHVDRLNVYLHYNQKNLENIEKGMSLKEIHDISGVPYIKFLIYHPESSNDFYVPIIDQKFKEKYLIFGFYAESYSEMDSKDKLGFILEEKIPRKVISGMIEDKIKEILGNPSKELWLFLKNRSLSEVTYKNLIFAEGKLQSIETLIHSSLGLIKSIPEN